jgi:transitional endoplasmic reticulum ATPase
MRGSPTLWAFRTAFVLAVTAKVASSTASPSASISRWGVSRGGATTAKPRRRRRKTSSPIDDEKDPTTAIMERKVNPSTVLVDEALSDEDPSSVHLSAKKMEELDIFHGDTVVIRGKKRKETMCCAYRDDTVTDNEIRMNRVTRSNLRVRLGDPVNIRTESNVKYAASVKVQPFEDTLEGFKGDLKEDVLTPYFEGKFRPVILLQTV